MFEILIAFLCVLTGKVDFHGQFEDSGGEPLFLGVCFGKLDFEEVEPIFWFHLLEGANLKVPHCGTVTANGAGPQVDLAQLQAQQ